jgi:hypothetical protein
MYIKEIKLNPVALVRKRTRHQSSDRFLSAKLVPTFVDRGCHVVSATNPHGRQSRFSRHGAATFTFKYVFSYTHEAEWTPFQTHYFLENLVAPGIEPWISGSVARNSDH